MRHGNYGNYFSGMGNGFLVLIIFAICVATAVIIIRALKKSDPLSASFNQTQKETLENFSSLVCAMLSQSGKGLSQIEISANLNLPVDIVAAKLAEMEKQGELSRVWDNNEYTFMVKKCV
jgi:hypothetical protein